MMTMKSLEQKLRRASQKQARLYLFCNFISLLLITAYCAMMFSPTVLSILPEGGDSRKQIVMIFVLTMFGCVTFTIYASGLFFRQKAKALGILMALGASRKRLSPGLFREVLLLSSVSSLLGIMAGLPFVWLLWNSFRLLIVDSQEMTLQLDFRCLLLSAAFFLLVVALSCLNAYRYLKRTDIMNVVHEEHKNEPVKEFGPWCGPVGILLLLAGAVAGYEVPFLYEKLFSTHAPGWIDLFYLPAILGLYMIMLHTVTHGWRSNRKNPYKNIIARSMMKFQGKQTLNCLLVSTVLIAGSLFAIFYIPMMGTSHLLDVNSRPFDYSYHYRQDQEILEKHFGEKALSEMAEKYGVAIKDFRNVPYIFLALDGYTEVEEGRSYYVEHRDFLMEAKFISASSFEALTGETLTVKEGTYYPITNKNEVATYFLNPSASFLTNMITFQTLPVSCPGYAHYDFLDDRKGYYILNDEDYERISVGLTDEWKGRLAFFNIDGEDSYAFAQDFFYSLVRSFGLECEYPVYYDRVEKYDANLKGETYWGDTERMTPISFDRPDASDFRIYWTFMPQSRILDKMEFLRTFSVYLMMFLFISIICCLASLIIGYMRCMTIVLNNRYVFDDLKRLGASPSFLLREVKRQASVVFKIPCIVGMTAMYSLYVLLMLGNDGRLTTGEIAGLLPCLGILFLVAGIFYLVFRYTVRKMERNLSPIFSRSSYR